MKIRQNKAIIISLFILLYLPAFSQGGWNINYLPIGNLNSSYVGKQIFLDIKNNNTDTINQAVSFIEVRNLLADNREDEIVLSISGRQVTFVEDWRIFVDEGFVEDQVFINEENEVIKDIFLVGLSSSTISLRANLYTSDTNFTTIEFVVSRDKVKGFLTLL